MRVVKTDRSCHGGLGIFSVDIQPNDRRFATGGRAENGSGLVIIWDLRSILEHRNGSERRGFPLPLCRLENHVGCVNCVRWSESGKFLASSGDDSLITIMHYAGKLASAAEDNLSSLDSGKQKNIEAWKCAHTLRGHAADVLHVAWSPGDLYLASCSIDNQIIVWHGQKFEKVATLSGHKGLVKGVTWDPVGKFLASQSDDRSVRIWTTSSWTLKKVIQGPFRECDATTQFLRLDWAPDGTVISSAHAMNNGGPVSKLIDRAGWETELDFVGHRKAVTCTRWSPCIYEIMKPDSNKPVQFCVCAVGSKDRSFSLWTPAFKRPFAVVDEAFTQGLMDVSWSHSGYVVAASSSDGALLFMIFDKSEIGRVLSSAEKVALLNEAYGQYGVSSLANGYSNGYNSAASTVISDPEFMKLQQNHKAKEAGTGSSKQSTIAAANGPSSSAAGSLGSTTQLVQAHPSSHQQKQVEVKTKDGKRRIQPVFLGSTVITEPAEEVTAPVPIDSGQSATPLTTAIDSRMETEPVVSAASKESVTNKEGEYNTQVPAEKQDGPHAAPAHAAVVPKAHGSDTTATFKGVQIKRKQGEAPTSRSSKKSRQTPQAQPRRNRRRISSSEDEEVETAQAATEDKGTAEAGTSNQQENTCSAHASAVSLSVPHKVRSLVLNIQMTTNRGMQNVEIKCTNALRIVPNVASGATLAAVQGKSLLWQMIFGTEVLAMAANPLLVAVVGANRRLFVFESKNGSRLMPPIALDADISILTINRYFVMCLTSMGTVQVWDFECPFKCVCKESLRPIITDSRVSVSSGFVTDYGAPLLILSDGKSYVYNSDMRSWVSVFDPQDTLTTVSVVLAQSPLLDTHQSKGPFATCLRAGVGMASLTRSQLTAAAAHCNQDHPAAMAVTAFLESQVHSALELRSAQEYHFWFMQYVQHLAKEGIANKLKQVCQDLMDSAFGGASSSRKSDTILGFSKKALLKDILPVIATNAKLQRLYGEIKEQMSETKNRSGSVL